MSTLSDKMIKIYKNFNQSNDITGLPTLTHLTSYSRNHALDKFTHAFKKSHTHTHAT